ncbi:uncharacterized protein RJT21DRAFT_12298 [Scheffersomyces amazonensis]|uniref:uncharacterized protein n=1 Tax=Scheffersomyces amazonensis TaxID=1078765 RepID=UPI00315D8D3E
MIPRLSRFPRPIVKIQTLSIPQWRRGGTKLVRHFSTNQYNYYQPYQKSTSVFTKFLYTVVAIGVVGGYGYYMFWPKHTFPSSVAKILRKGLWAESEKGENDYQLALKYYLEALKHCDEIGMDIISDEYTGIQLKAAEMFERLNMIEDSLFIYNEIATIYLTALSALPGSEEAKLIKNFSHRRHIIQKDLRIALKLVDLNRHDPSLVKSILFTHLIIAQDEINKHVKVANMAEFKDDKSNVDITFKSLDKSAYFLTDPNTGETTSIKTTPEIWEPFADEYFTGMEVLSAICVGSGDFRLAFHVKILTLESMLIAGIEPSRVLSNQCNLASILFLLAGEHEALEYKTKKKIAKSLDINHKQLSIDEVLSSSTEIGKKIALSLPEERKQLETAHISKDNFFKLSYKSYESILTYAKTVLKDSPSSSSDSQPQVGITGLFGSSTTISSTNLTKSVNETVALATYSLGVLNLHLSKYDTAERFLRESRVRARTCGYDDLLEEIEIELEKLFKEKKAKALITSDINESSHVSASAD